MPKTLLLLRHGKTHRDGYAHDRERELKPRGHTQARRIAKILKSSDLMPDRIISSSAVRARETAEICTDELDIASPVDLRDDLYGIHASDLIRFCLGLDDAWECVLLVGHNPAFEEAASILAGRSVSLGTGDCAVLRYHADSWSALIDQGAPEKFELIQSD